MRGGLSGLMAIVAALVLPLGLVSAWTAQKVTDRDGYVSAVAPLASDPAVRREVSARLVTLATGALTVDPDDVVPGSGQVASLVVEQAVAGALRSRVFQQTWRAANRTAHGQLLAILRGRDGGEVTLDLAPVLRRVVEEVAGYGLPVTQVPTDRTTIRLATGPSLGQAQQTYAVLDRVGYLGLLAWVVLIGLALLVARRRAAALVFVTVTTALAAAGTLGALLLGRSVAAGAVAPDDRALTEAVADVLTASLQTALVGVLIGAGVVGAAALLAAAVGRARQEG